MTYSFNYSKPAKPQYIIAISIGWFLISILVDHFIFRQRASWYTRLFALENGKISFDPFYRDVSQLSFTTFLLVPFIIIILTLTVLAIWKKIKRAELFKSISALIWSLSFILLAVVVGHIIYRLISGIEWAFIKVITNFCEGYKIEGQIYLFNLHIVDIKSGVGALVGLAVGFYSYYKRGILKILIERAGLDLS